MLVPDIADDAIFADTIFPVAGQFSGKCLAYLARVLARRDPVIKEVSNAPSRLAIDLAQ